MRSEKREMTKSPRERRGKRERGYRCEGACACHCYILAPATKLGPTFWRTRTHHIRSSCYSRVCPTFLPGAEHLATNCVKRVHDFEWRVSRDVRRDRFNHSLSKTLFHKICSQRCKISIYLDLFRSKFVNKKLHKQKLYNIKIDFY